MEDVITTTKMENSVSDDINQVTSNDGDPKEPMDPQGSPEYAGDLNTYIGGIGTYQLVVFVLICCIGACVDPIYINFTGGYQEHWCTIDALENFTHSQQKYIGIPYDSDGDYDHCKMFQLNYSSYSIDELLNWNRSLVEDGDTAILDCTNGWTYDQSHYVNTIRSRLDLVCDQQWMVSMISTMMMAGIMVGVLLSGFFIDWFGRKLVFNVSVVIRVLSVIMISFRINFPWVAITRFILGFAATTCISTGCIIVMELVTSTWRSRLGMGLFIMSSIGFTIAPAFAYVIRDDIKFQLTMALPQIVFIAYVWIIDESPRWLLVTCRFDKATALIKKICAINGKELPGDFNSKTLSKHGENKEKKKTRSILDFLKSSRLRRRALIIYLQWFTASLMYYALSLNTGVLHGDVYVNTAISGAVEIPANLLGMFMLNWQLTGRRITTGVAFLIAGVSSLISIYMVLEDIGYAHTVFSMIAKAFVTMGFNAIIIYTSELYPTEVRGAGSATSEIWASIGGLIAPFVGGSLIDVWAPLPQLICGVLALATGIFTFFLPETLGHKLVTTIEEAEALGRDSKDTPDGTVEIFVVEQDDIIDRSVKQVESVYL